MSHRFTFRPCATTALLAACACLLSVLIAATPVSAADDSAWDGAWTGKLKSTCGARGYLQMEVKDGELSGRSQIKGSAGSGAYDLSGYLNRSGQITDGKMKGRYAFNFLGGFDDIVANGRFEGPVCTGSWTVARVDQPPTFTDADGYDGEWSGKYSSTCEARGTLKMTIHDGDIEGEMVVRGTSDLDGTHPLTGYIDRKGRIAEGITSGTMIARLLGQFSPTSAKGQIKVPECQANWKMTRRSGPARQQIVEGETSRPATEITKTSAPRDIDAPVIALPGEILTDGPLVTVIGAISDASGVAQVQIDGETLALGQSGVVNLQRAVPIGTSEITVSAVDEWGNRSEQRVRVIRRSASVDTNTEVAELKAEDLDLGNFVALVIGNNDYGVMPDLNTAVDDARAVANVLKSNYGFTVRTLENATRYDILGAMSEMRASLQYDDNLLIYYAGHGIVDAVTERGYWLPVDADESNPSNWISNADITDQLKAMPARHVLVIADSCYSGTLTRASAAELDTWQDRRAWLERVSGKRSRTALSSGGLEPVNDAGGGRHSVFASALLDALTTNEQIVDAQSLFDPVRKRVVLNADQTPQYSDVRLAGHEGGDFIFVPQ